jgi:hypothetical protein
MLSCLQKHTLVRLLVFHNANYLQNHHFVMSQYSFSRFPAAWPGSYEILNPHKKAGKQLPLQRVKIQKERTKNEHEVVAEKPYL